MRIETLMEEQRAATGFTHRVTIEYTDLNTTAATTKTVELPGLTTLPIKQLVRAAAFEVETAFVGASITVLTLDVGYDLASGTDDPDAFIDAVDMLTALGGDGNGAVFATLRTGFVNGAATMDIEALFTATGANLTALTAGKVHFYLAVNDLTKLR